MAKRPTNQRWLQRQQKDLYVKKSKQSHYRSRAVYKLMEIDQKDRLFKPGQTVIDLGAAPGSWSQYACEKTGIIGRVIAIDILPMESINNVEIIQGDFTRQQTYENCLELMNNDKADLVISDMAPNISGIRSTDQARCMLLAELARDLAFQVLKPGGHLLIKLFQGEGIDGFKQDLREHFQQKLTRKPEASRENSREFYMLAKGFAL